MQNLLFMLWALSLLAPLSTYGQEFLFLRNNLQYANVGDFIVTSQGKNGTFLHIYAKGDHTITIEEISIPLSKLPPAPVAWQKWLSERARGNTSWIIYQLESRSGRMLHYFSVSRNGWFHNSQQEHFLHTLLNIPFSAIPDQDRRRVGIPLPGSLDKRPLWQPLMVFNGQKIPNVEFSAWRTCWPKDNSELSGKSIEVFIPKDGARFPSYFPYWLQVSTMGARASVRVIDAGSGLLSPITLTMPTSKLDSSSHHASEQGNTGAQNR